MLKNAFYDQVMPQLPKKWMSHWVGSAAHLQLPARITQTLIRSFVKLYKINTLEIEKPLEEYQSLGEFFSRKLREGARPIQGDLVHPCDGLLVQSGFIHDQLLIQAKGKTFKLNEFVPGNPWAGDFEEGTFFNYYLAPHNYHRVHSPLTGEIQWSMVIPGELWPVNSWSVRNKEGLYAINERVAVGIQTSQGKMILVMVGATNVGSMSFSFDPNIRTNRRQNAERVYRAYPESRAIQVGEEFGVFHLGSTVVTLFEKSFDRQLLEKQKVLMGQPVQ
ncbi:MAG: phosphatidylserine decarboxylase [Bdellovibrionales bacterium]|nr:phosphatidylserine decarboxylase [Bdellovibrionales bacterium]